MIVANKIQTRFDQPQLGSTYPDKKIANAVEIVHHGAGEDTIHGWLLDAFTRYDDGAKTCRTRASCTTCRPT